MGTLFTKPKPWNPLLEGDQLQIWVDLQDYTSVTFDNEVITNIADKSGKNRHFSNSDPLNATQYSYQPTGLNGLPCIYYPGTAGALLKTAAFAITTPAIVACVVQDVGTDQSIAIGGICGGGGQLGIFVVSRSLFCLDGDGANQLNSAITAKPINVPRVIIGGYVTNTTANTYIYEDDVSGLAPEQTAVPVRQTPTIFELLGRTTNGAYPLRRAKAKLSELFVVSGLHSRKKLQQIAFYLGNKWNLRNNLIQS